MHKSLILCRSLKDRSAGNAKIDLNKKREEQELNGKEEKSRHKGKACSAAIFSTFFSKLEIVMKI